MNTSVTTLPPGLNQPIQGSLHLHLSSLSFTSQTLPPLPSLLFSCKFWGQPQTPSSFSHSPKGTYSISYNICCSKDIFSKYLLDMQTLLIFMSDGRNGKRVGVVPVQWKRYWMGGEGEERRMEERVRERVGVMDMKKGKIGEVEIGVEMEFWEVKEERRVAEVEENWEDKGVQEYQNYQKPEYSEYTPTPPQKFPEKQENPPSYHPPLPPLPPREPKPLQYPLPTSPPLSIPPINLQLQTLKLKNDFHLFLKKPPTPLQPTLPSSCLQYTIQILHLKLRNRPPSSSKPSADKLTLIYPHHHSISTPTHITSTLNPTKIQNNLYHFGQQIVLKIKNQEEQRDGVLEVYFGEGHGEATFDKLKGTETQQITITLRKKDNTKHSELTILANSTPPLTQHLKCYLYLGKYSLYDPSNNYFLRLNFGSTIESKTIFLPSGSAGNVGFQSVWEGEGEKEVVCFVEVWKREKEGKEGVKGCLQLRMGRGSLYQKMGLEGIGGESIGWVEVFWCREEEKRVDGVIREWKERVKGKDQEEKREIREEPNRNNNSGNLPLQQQLPQNIPIPSPCSLSPSTLYCKLLNTWHLSIDPSAKSLADHLLSLPPTSLSPSLFLPFLSKLLSPSESSSFLSLLPPNLHFKSLLSSYYAYSHYLSLYRHTLNTLLSHLHSPPYLPLLPKLVKLLEEATGYFGYLEEGRVRELFEEAGVGREVGENVGFFWKDDGEGEGRVWRKGLVDGVKGGKVEGMVPNGRVMGYLVRREGKGEEGEWNEEEMTHFEYIVLKDNPQETLPDLPQISLLSSSQLSNLSLPSIPPSSPNTPNIHQIKPEPQFIPNLKFQPPILLPIKIHSIQSSIPSLTDIIINNKIYLSPSQLPKIIKLQPEQEVVIRVHTSEGIIMEGIGFVEGEGKEGSIVLFVGGKGKEVGRVYWGEQERGGDIVVKYEGWKEIEGDTRKGDRRIEQVHEIQPPAIFSLANTPLTLQILDITPHGQYSLLFPDCPSPSPLRYPQQTALPFSSPLPLLPLTITNISHTSSSPIHLHEGTSKYAFAKNDGSVFCIVELKISQRASHFSIENSSVEREGQGRRLFLIIKDLYSFEGWREGEKPKTAPLVYLLIQYNNTFKKTQQFPLRYKHPVDFSLEIQESPSYSIKLFSRKNTLLSKFQFKIALLPPLPSLQHSPSTLSSSHYRLSLTLFQLPLTPALLSIRPDRIENIMKIFEIAMIKMVSRELVKHNNRELRDVLRKELGYTLTEIGIIEEMVGEEGGGIWGRGEREGNTKIRVEGSRVKQILEEFSVFDFDGDGFVGREQAKGVCKLLGIEGEEIERLIENSQEERIIDCNKKSDNQVDYFSLLIQISPNSPLFFPPHHPHPQPSLHPITTGPALISLLGFSNLLHHSRPPNICFQINNEFLAPPILRCSTYEYSPEECPTRVVELPTRVKMYNKEYGGGGDDLWSYRLVGECEVAEVVEVLGGTVRFGITKVESGEVERENKSKKEQEKKENREVSRQLNKNDERFQKQSPEKIEVQEEGGTFQKQQNLEALRETRKMDLTEQEMIQAQRINSILTAEVNISKYRFQSSDEEDS